MIPENKKIQTQNPADRLEIIKRAKEILSELEGNDKDFLLIERADGLQTATTGEASEFASLMFATAILQDLFSSGHTELMSMVLILITMVEKSAPAESRLEEQARMAKEAGQMQ